LIGVDTGVTVGDLDLYVTHGQRRADEWAMMCARKIMYVSEAAPQPIRDQAYAFQSQMADVITNYIKMAIEEDRTNRG